MTLILDKMHPDMVVATSTEAAAAVASVSSVLPVMLATGISEPVLSGRKLATAQNIYWDLYMQGGSLINVNGVPIPKVGRATTLLSLSSEREMLALSHKLLPVMLRGLDERDNPGGEESASLLRYFIRPDDNRQDLSRVQGKIAAILSAPRKSGEAADEVVMKAIDAPALCYVQLLDVESGQFTVPAELRELVERGSVILFPDWAE